MRVSCVVLSAVMLAACGGSSESSGEFFVDLGGNRLEVSRGSTGALAVKLLADEGFEDEVTVRAAVMPETIQASGGLAFKDQIFPAERTVTFEIPVDPATSAGTEFDVEVVAVSREHRAAAQMRVVVKDAGGAPDPSFADGQRALLPATGDGGTICAVAPATTQLTVFAAVEAGEYVLRAFDGTGKVAGSFGAAGVVRTGMQSSAYGRCRLLRDELGGLLLVGHRPGELAPIFIARYVAAGVLDTTYGVGGVAVPAGASGDILESAVAHPDGGAVVLASTVTPVDGLLQSVVVLMRVDQRGKPTAGFGVNGRAVHPDATMGVYSGRVAVTDDGRLLVARSVRVDQTYTNLVLERFLPTGNRDESYAGGAGSVAVSFAGESFVGEAGPRELLVQADGKVLVRSNFGAYSQAQVRRFTSEGAVDTSFGIVGVVQLVPTTTDTNHEPEIGGLALDATGRAIAAVSYPAFPQEVRLVRLQPDGTYDASFGVQGQYRLLRNDSGYDWVTGVSVLPDGRIVTVGRRITEEPGYYFATRTLP